MVSPLVSFVTAHVSARAGRTVRAIHSAIEQLQPSSATLPLDSLRIAAQKGALGPPSVPGPPSLPAGQLTAWLQTNQLAVVLVEI